MWKNTEKTGKKISLLPIKAVLIPNVDAGKNTECPLGEPFWGAAASQPQHDGITCRGGWQDREWQWGLPRELQGEPFYRPTVWSRIPYWPLEVKCFMLRAGVKCQMWFYSMIYRKRSQCLQCRGTVVTRSKGLSVPTADLFQLIFIITERIAGATAGISKLSVSVLSRKTVMLELPSKSQS